MFYDDEDFKPINESHDFNGKKILVEGRLLDYAIIAAIGWRFARKFEKWKAYKLGIIDDKGNILKSPKTREEKDAFTPLDNVILRIKKLIQPRLWYLLGAAYIFKGFFLKESNDYSADTTVEEIQEREKKLIALKKAKKRVYSIIKESQSFDEEEFWSYMMTSMEESEEE